MVLGFQSAFPLSLGTTSFAVSGPSSQRTLITSHSASVILGTLAIVLTGVRGQSLTAVRIARDFFRCALAACETTGLKKGTEQEGAEITENRSDLDFISKVFCSPSVP